MADLTAAVEAAARQYNDIYGIADWEALSASVQHTIREHVLPIVKAAFGAVEVEP